MTGELLEPLPCPFCGRSPRRGLRAFASQWHRDNSIYKAFVICYCESDSRISTYTAYQCAKGRSPEEAHQNAVSYWNRRA
jgi:hypothetical protein